MELKPDIDIALVGDEKQNDINIYLGGRNEYIVKDFHAGPFIRDFYDVEYCTRGNFILYADEKVYEISEGDLYIAPPHMMLKKHFTADISATAYVGAKGIKLSRYFKALGISSENILFPHKLTDTCKAHFERLIDSLEVCETLSVKNVTDIPVVDFVPNASLANNLGFEAELRQAAHFSLFLAELMSIRGANIKKRAEKTVQQEYIDAALRYIETNYHLDISVESIAKHVGINRSYLFRLFREEYGMSVHDYLIRVRMHAAREFLRQPNIQIKTVAASVGYEQFNFSRIFKRVIGMSPQEYRRKHLK